MDKDWVFFTLLLLAVWMVGYGAWKVERRLNYRLSYQGQVQKEIEPLANRIDDLEKRLSILEKKQKQ